MRQRAADLLYAMCDRSNAKQIVSEMLRYLETADYAIREEIVSWAPGCEGGQPGPWTTESKGGGLGSDPIGWKEDLWGSEKKTKVRNPESEG